MLKIETPWWILGVCLSLVASLFGTLGKVLMKLSHMQGGNTVLFFAATICVVLLNPLFDAMSYAYAAQTILSPMAGISVAWNIILSPSILNESLTHTDIQGTKWILIGCFLVSLTGSHVTPHHTRQQIFLLFQEKLFIFYNVVMVFICLGLSGAIWFLSHKNPFRRLAFGLLSGLVGGNLFYLKAAVELINQGDDVWEYYETYCIIFGALCTAGGGILILNTGLKHYNALYLVALYQSCLIIIGSISGVIFFQEAHDMSSSWQILSYPLSIAATVYGIVILSSDVQNMKYYSHESKVLLPQNLESPR